MFEFDHIIEQTCAEGNISDVDPTTCKPTTGDPGDDPPPPSTDDRCADPGFYDANPDICAGYPRLILKPEFALVQVAGTVLYKTFLRTSGDEVELTNGLDYSSANNHIASFELAGGLATGAAVGITTMAVAWHNLHAYAQIQVVESCADTSMSCLLLIDDSKSMKANFDPIYATRLDFAKAAARAFAEAFNYAKDRLAVYRFDVAGAQVLPLSTSQDDVGAAIDSIVQTENLTNIYEAFNSAKQYLEGQSGPRCIIILTDGEDGGDSDPIPLAKEFRGAGNFVVAVGIRCWGPHFDLLYKMASTGFFLSAYHDTAADVMQILPGLKTYMCSGDCHPDPGVYHEAKYDYRNFKNWERLFGLVDLIGYGVQDLQPGHGLYLDLNNIKLQTYDAFDFEAGKTYRLSFKLAGNLRDEQTDGIRVQIGTLLDQTIIMPWDSPFAVQTLDFTPGASSSEKIKISSLNNDVHNNGCLLDDVQLENLTDSLIMFIDTFDTENEVIIDAGYGYYYGCLAAPPSAQAADPTPPDELESELSDECRKHPELCT